MNEIGIEVTGLIEQASKINIATASFSIDNQKGLEDGAYIIKTIADIKAEINATSDPIISKQYAAHKEACAQKKKHLQPMVEAETRIRGLMSKYYAAQKLIQRENEAKAARKAAQEAQKLSDKAEKLADDGKHDRAEIMQQKADTVQAAPIEPAVVKPAGIAFKDSWKWRVLPGGKVPRNFLCLDTKKLDQTARDTKGTLIIEGIQFYCEKVTARTGR